jgi:hypothetical protein
LKEENICRIYGFYVVVMKKSSFWDAVKAFKKSNDILKEHVTSIFRIEEYSRQGTAKISVDFQHTTQCYIPEDVAHEH